jgi:hypothetical protein
MLLRAILLGLRLVSSIMSLWQIKTYIRSRRLIVVDLQGA